MGGGSPAGYLWTPAYWGWGGDRFLFHEGYWGPRVGFYGGINYGFGYFGDGYEGGRWDHGRFFYNRSVNNVNVTNIHNVYNTTIINRTTGESGQLQRRQRWNQRARDCRTGGGPPRETYRASRRTDGAHAGRVSKTVISGPRQTTAGRDCRERTDREQFNEHGVVPAREAGAPYNGAANRGAHGQFSSSRKSSASADLPAHERPAAPNTGNQKQDQKYQQQQEKLVNKQNQEHQKLSRSRSRNIRT